MGLVVEYDVGQDGEVVVVPCAFSRRAVAVTAQEGVGLVEQVVGNVELDAGMRGSLGAISHKAALRSESNALSGNCKCL
ncbi:hypothetical protein AGMMS50225_25330 [Betaproteobacteria bacterium]|nr:hypothetical protein AGMMS50225_25330 [Betaproteobacteria bacterium]